MVIHMVHSIRYHMGGSMAKYIPKGVGGRRFRVRSTFYRRMHLNFSSLEGANELISSNERPLYIPWFQQKKYEAQSLTS